MAAVAEAVLRGRQLFILPSRHGLTFFLMLVVLLLASIKYGNGLGYALTFLLAALAGVTMLHTHRNLHRLRIMPGSCAPVFAGETAMFEVCLVNDTSVPRYGVGVEYQNAGAAASLDLAAHASLCASLRVPATRRGYLPSPPFRLIGRFPLGLFRVWTRHFKLRQSCLVYPQPAPAQPFPPPQRADDAPSEQHRGRSRGDDFIGLREFHHGDSSRHVDWKAVARGQGWLIKEFGAGTQPVVWLDWEMLVGLATEERLSLLCRWVLDAERAELRYGLELPGGRVAPGSGEAHQRRCLEALALHPA